MFLTSSIELWRAVEVPSEFHRLKVHPHEELVVIFLVQEEGELLEPFIGGSHGRVICLVVHDVIKVLEHPLDPCKKQTKLGRQFKLLGLFEAFDTYLGRRCSL